MLKIVLPILTALLFGFLAGYLLRDKVLAEFSQSANDNAPYAANPNAPGPRRSSIDPGIRVSGIDTNPETKRTKKLTWDFEDIDDQATVFDQLIIAYRLAAESDPVALEALIKRCLRSSDPFYNPHLVAIFIEKYTAIDPLKALAFVSSEPGLNEQYLVGHILTSWVRTDPEAAVAYYTSLNNQMLVRSIGPRLLTDPAVARAGLSNEIEDKIGPGSQMLVDQIKAQTTPPAELFENAMLLTGNRRTTQLQQALSAWASRDPEAALARINLMPNASERERFTQTAMMIYSQVDPENALAYMRNTLVDNPQIEATILSAIARADPENSLALIEEFSQRTGDTSPIVNLLSFWASKDPAKAIAYAATRSEAIQAKAYSGIAYNYVRSHPTEGVDWLLGLGDEHRQTKQNVLRSLVRVDSQLAEDTVRKVNDIALRGSLINSLASHKSASDPAQALDWINQFQEEPVYRQARTTILRNWANSDPEKAVNEISDELDEDVMAPILSQVASSWFRRSPEDALNWVESLPAGTGRERAITSMVGLVAAKDPDDAIKLANQISNQQNQRDAKRSIAYSWYAREPDQLENIISRLQLTEQDANQLRQARRGEL